MSPLHVAPPSLENSTHALTLGEMGRASKIADEKARRAFVKGRLIYGGRRWCLIQSPNLRIGDEPQTYITALAVRIDLLQITDMEELPPPLPWLTDFAWQKTTKGAHIWRPVGSLKAFSHLDSVKPKMVPGQAKTAHAAPWDRRYEKLSYFRGYWHERPRVGEVYKVTGSPASLLDVWSWAKPGDVIVPPPAMADPKWWEFLQLHIQWHRYAVAVMRERGEVGGYGR